MSNLINLQVPQSPKPGFSRKSKVRTVTFSGTVQRYDPEDDSKDLHPSNTRSRFFHEAKKDGNQGITENLNSLPHTKEYTGRNAVLYNYLQDFLHFTLGNDDDEDVFHKIEEETHLKKELTEIPQLFRQHTKITNKRRPDFLKVTEMNKIEKVYVDFDLFPDKYPMKQFRKYVVLGFRYSEAFSQYFIKSKLFEVASLIVILMNCVTYILKQNKQGEYNTYLSVINRFETSFLVFYLIEMAMKMMAVGLLMNRNSYFRDGWNILDFFVIINLILLYYNVTYGIIKDYSLLRIIRLLRPLRALTRFKHLRTIISSLFAALPLLLDFLSILLFFFLIYAAVGLHLFSGLLMYRCHDIYSGMMIDPETLCGNLKCPTNSECFRGLDNWGGGVNNFDNLLASMLQVILIATLDNWTVTMYNIQRAFTNFAWVYFVSLVIIGNYVLLNLTLALIKVKFSETHNYVLNEKSHPQKTIQTYDFLEIKRQGLWITKRKIEPMILRENHMTDQDLLVQPQKEKEEEDTKENLEDPKNLIKLFKDSHPMMKLQNMHGNQGGTAKNSAYSLVLNSKMESSKRRRGLNVGVLGSGMSAKSKTFKSYKSKSSSMVSRRTKKDMFKVTPISRQRSSKFEPVYSSESLLSFITLDENHSMKNAKNFKNRCLRHILGLFGRVIRVFPYRKNMKHQTIFHLEPKYLKLIVNFEREFKSLSEEDILPNRDEEEKNKKLQDHINLIKKKKLPIIYTPKKKKASLMKFLRQIYSKKVASNMNKSLQTVNSPGGKDILMLSSHSETSLTSIEEKFFKSYAGKKGIAVKATKRFSRDNKQNSNAFNWENNAANQLENYVVNINDLFRGEVNARDKDKNAMIAKEEEKIKKKLDQLKEKYESPTVSTNYIWVRNLINQNIDESKEDEDKDSDDQMARQSIDMAKKYLEIRKKDLEHNNIHSYTWSGEDVLATTFAEHLFDRIFQQLNDPDARIYYQQAKGKLGQLRVILGKMIHSNLFHTLLILVITSYLIALAVSSNLEESLIIHINLVFTSIFVFEMLIKVVAFGLKVYLRDHLNKNDVFVIWASLIELVLMSNPDVKEYRYVRFLTAVKVFRIARIIENIKFIKFLINVIGRTISSFIYLAFLLILLNFVYALIGMEIFGGNINKSSSKYFNINFDTFWVAFLTVFNLMTLDNWIDFLREGFNSSVGIFGTTVFVISWIIIGNFLLLNLFLAILLDGFTTNMEMQELQKIIDEEQEEKERDDYIHAKTQGRQEDLNIIIPKDARQAFIDELTKYFVYNSKYNEKYNEKETKLLTLLELDIIKDRTQNSAYQTNNFVPLARIKCEKSLWIWGKGSEFRKLCHYIIFHIYFQKFMVVILCLSTLVLILQTYYEHDDNANITLKYITVAFDNIFFLIFIIEAFLKIVVLGFYNAQKSYLRNNWQVFDLLIIIVYFLELWLTVSTQDYFLFTKVVRMVKVLRPFSLISYNPNIYTVCKALWESSLDILKVLFVIFTLWFTYALLGVILFRGRFGFCEDVNNFGVNRERCLAESKQWQIYPYNFDNIYNAFVTLFIISTYDGWNQIMSVGVNSGSENEGPIRFSNQYSSYIFFLSFVIFGVMFLINLFTGVIFYNFTMAEKMTKHKYLSDSQVTWLNLHKLILLADPYFEYSKPPTSFGKRLTFNIIRSKTFRFFIYACLLANVIILLVSYNNMKSIYSQRIVYAHQVFNCIFLLEGILKIFTFGFQGYFFDDWNKLDLCIIFTGLSDFFLTFIWPSYLKILRTSPQIVNGLRIIRILRLIRVLRKRRGIDKLLHTLMFSLPMVINIFSLSLMVYYVYAMFGCYFFGEISNDGLIDDYINFKNFSYALMTLYKISTADGWEDVMMTISNFYPWAPLYFISFYIITTNILINLLVLVLLQQFENYHLDPGNPIHTFKDFLLKFRKVWGMYTAKQNGKKIHHRLLIPFFQKLSPPLGFEEFEDIDIIQKGIMEMKLVWY